MNEPLPDPHLDAALRTLREHTAMLAAPRAVEDALLAAFAQQHRVKRARWYTRLSLPRWSPGMGLAGLADVAVNVQGTLVEQAADKPLMSGFHCLWSVGCIAGAGEIGRASCRERV